jgi:wobble nucleotide-excising tRNase
MFKKVSKLEKFGIFRNFTWDNTTPDFSRFNLIFGWNKSGKTTFSRAFVACEKKTTDFKNYPRDKDGNIIGKFEIKTEKGTVISHSNCQRGSKQIRVFNKDFIEDNVSFDPTNPSNPIVYVSEEDIESNKRLKELQGKITPLAEKYESTHKDRQRYEKVEDNFRKSIALNIKNIIGNLKINDKYRDYDKGSVKTVIEEIGTENFSKISGDDFEKKKKLISSEPLNNQALFPKYDFSFSYNGKNLNSFSEVFNEIKKLLKRKVIAETIDRLKIDPELNKWAQQGFELHKTKDEKERCLFCQSRFSAGFLNSLSKHFSNDYEKLQSDINSFIKCLEILKHDEVTEENQNLYADLQHEYKNQAKELNEILDDLSTWVDEAVKKLKDKHDNPLLEISDPQPPKKFSDLFDKKVEDINAIIKAHNTKVENHEQEVIQAKEELEKHLIATAIDEQDYLKIKSEFDKSIEAEKEAKKEVDENDKEISKLEKETSNIGKALQKINKHLEEFFGRKEILLELDNLKKGYIIKRDGDVANNLSEGEKNAIAFSYFIVKTQEKGFKIKEGIIIIDDPVSSFDSNFIYHCFSLIKNHFKDAEQLIISTHNFEFFNLIKNWFGQKNRKVDSDNKKIVKESDKKPIPCEFFMVENIIENGKRCASIIPLEETLQKFKSEYHFLFSRLNKFITDGAPNYADFYIIGNIARRFLEIYINFKIPTTGDLKSRIDQLETKTVSETEKDKVYKLIQEFSHGFDPSSTIEHKDKSEIQNGIRVLMKIVEESDRKHFESLQNNL